MRLSKWSYYADLVVYPVLIAAVETFSLQHATPGATARWLGLATVSLLAWTALEYALHRWLLHRVPPFRRMHARHHEHPAALIGTPTWITVPLFVALWLLLAREASVAAASAMVTGLMAGYLFYVVFHDAVHHRRTRPGSWLHAAKLRHGQHHLPSVAGNFGVTSGLWDSVLGTVAGSVVVGAEVRS